MIKRSWTGTVRNGNGQERERSGTGTGTVRNGNGQEREWERPGTGMGTVKNGTERVRSRTERELNGTGTGTVRERKNYSISTFGYINFYLYQHVFLPRFSPMSHNLDSAISHFIYINVYYRNRQVDLSETEVYNSQKYFYLNACLLILIIIYPRWISLYWKYLSSEIPIADMAKTQTFGRLAWLQPYFRCGSVKCLKPVAIILILIHYCSL